MRQNLAKFSCLLNPGSAATLYLLNKRRVFPLIFAYQQGWSGPEIGARMGQVRQGAFIAITATPSG
jgi:hypothetical protein